jgi:hypothetical protein
MYTVENGVIVFDIHAFDPGMTSGEFGCKIYKNVKCKLKV